MKNITTPLNYQKPYHPILALHFMKQMPRKPYLLRPTPKAKR
ncbi:MAG: hypothetical protein ACP5J6_09340 [Candidatus Saccharicenans sp.]